MPFTFRQQKNEKNKKTQIQHAIRKQLLKIKAKKENTID